VIAARERIHAGGDKIVQRLCGHTGAMGKIFDICDDEISLVSLAKFWKSRDKGSPSDGANNVAEKEDV
jgi:hypothetical protein